MTIEGKATLRQAAGAMRGSDIGTLAVLDGPEIQGIISERDVTRAIADGADPDEIWVADVMTTEPRYVTTGERVVAAREAMVAAGVRHLPVLDEGEIVGIISIRDVLDSEVKSLVLDEHHGELRDLLDSALGDLSHEIADTDNAGYRALLKRRRERLREVRLALEE